MRISDWSSDVCSSDLGQLARLRFVGDETAIRIDDRRAVRVEHGVALADLDILIAHAAEQRDGRADRHRHIGADIFALEPLVERAGVLALIARSEEHTSELQSLMRISYAVFCLKKKQTKKI